MQINSNILMQINSKSYSEMTSADFIADVYLNDVSNCNHYIYFQEVIVIVMITFAK